jgi:CBS-domain-containing membrane protein
MTGESSARHLDRIAAAITDTNAAIEKLPKLHDQLWDAINEIQNNLRTIIKVDNAPELKALLRRTERIQELRRMMEMGALSVEARNVLDAAHKRLWS